MTESAPTEQPDDAPDLTLAGGADDASGRPVTLVSTPVALAVLGVLLALSALAGYSLHAVLGRQYAEQRRQLAAIEVWRTKVADSPDDVQSRLKLANSLVDAGQFRSALAEYETVLKENPNDVAALFGRASVLESMGQSKDAESGYWAVLRQEPGHVRAAEALGDFYIAKGQYRSAIVAVRPSVSLHPTEARLQYLMGFSYEKLGHRDWALQRYRLALEAVPDMSDATEALERLGAAK